MTMRVRDDRLPMTGRKEEMGMHGSCNIMKFNVRLGKARQDKSHLKSTLNNSRLYVKAVEIFKIANILTSSSNMTLDKRGET
ncbi:hypothetical protein E2C01_074083 [Portunus trituberculatus]|uniref:Uncharacterized protein n=1 Tax=Portunus trituberculatus TaxID=210409 RepID=A0A5B7IB92_PORTR|nr:hypothetical protein [Portunus trituberculatus]